MKTHLFDMLDLRRTVKAASVRNAIGDLAEAYACAALGYTRLRIDGRLKLCADARTPEGEPVEIKSVGKNGRALIYKWRMEKELAEIGDGYRYVFVRHTCPVTMPTAGAVADFFRDHRPELLLCTLADIRAAIGTTPPRSFRIFTGEPGAVQDGTAPKFDRQTQHGSQRAGYVEGGWQFALHTIPTTPAPESAPFEWRGQIITATIHTATLCPK